MNEITIIKNEVNKYDVDAVGIFGSRARGDNNEYSDYDIFIIGNLTLEKELELEENLKNRLNCQVDLVKITKNTDRMLLKNIANEAIVIYSKNNTYEKFYNFIETFFKENSDFIHLRERDLFDYTARGHIFHNNKINSAAVYTFHQRMFDEYEICDHVKYNKDPIFKLVKDFNDLENEIKECIATIDMCDDEKLKKLLYHSGRAYFLDFHILCEDYISINLKITNKFKNN